MIGIGRTGAAFMAAAFAFQPCMAQPMLTEHVLPMQLEIDAAQAAVAACAEGNFHISVVIVDAYGNTKLTLVSDNANFTTADSARRKAYTAVMLRQPTSALQTAIAAHPEAPLPGDGNPSMLFLAGGVPIRFGNEVVGGLGVGGAASLQDEKCAQAALGKIKTALER